MCLGEWDGTCAGVSAGACLVLETVSDPLELELKKGHRGCWELKLDSLQQHCEFSSAQPSLQPGNIYIYINFKF